MGVLFLKNIGFAIGKHFIKYGPTYAKIAIGVGVGTAIGLAACNHYYKKVIKDIRKADADVAAKAFAEKIKKLEEQYKHNEYVLKKKINDLCDELGIERIAW